MGTVNTQLVEQAQSIFDDLGYTVRGEGPGFRAERAWKVVHVFAGAEPSDDAADGQLWCYVTEPSEAARLERDLETVDPPYEWAIISVDEEDYRVERAPSADLAG